MGEGRQSVSVEWKRVTQIGIKHIVMTAHDR